MQQRAQQFLMDDIDGQASQIADARMKLMAQQAIHEETEEIPGEEEIKAKENALSEPETTEE